MSLWDLSVEDDGQDAGAPDVPPQLLFVHQGMDDPKEAKYHPQIPGLVMTTAADGGGDDEMPNSAGAAPN